MRVSMNGLRKQLFARFNTVASTINDNVDPDDRSINRFSSREAEELRSEMRELQSLITGLLCVYQTNDDGTPDPDFVDLGDLCDRFEKMEFGEKEEED